MLYNVTDLDRLENVSNDVKIFLRDLKIRGSLRIFFSKFGELLKKRRVFRAFSGISGEASKSLSGLPEKSPKTFFFENRSKLFVQIKRRLAITAHKNWGEDKREKNVK